jgi:hypothetical protein
VDMNYADSAESKKKVLFRGTVEDARQWCLVARGGNE